MIDYPDKRHSARQDQRRNFHPTLQSKHGADIIKPYWKLQERSTRSHTKANPPKLQQISKKKLKARRPWSNELKIIKNNCQTIVQYSAKLAFIIEEKENRFPWHINQRRHGCETTTYMKTFYILKERKHIHEVTGKIKLRLGVGHQLYYILSFIVFKYISK